MMAAYQHIMIVTMMARFIILASIFALTADATPSRQAWVVIPRGGDDYASQLEIVKSSVLDASNESVRCWMGTLMRGFL